MIEEKIIENGTIKDNEIKKNIRLLLSKFISLRRQGYVECIKKGSCGIGLTFESYLGKKADSNSTPDYYGIEIKTRRAYSKSFVTLFGISPQGKSENEAKRLRDIYGYPSPTGVNLKCLYSEVTCNNFCKAGIKHYFKLKLDKQQQKLFLQIYNKEKMLIEEDSYWDLATIKKRLYKKLKYLAYIKAWRKTICKKEYFKYFDIKFYVLKNFDQFLQLLEQDRIKVIIALNSSHDKNNYGQLMAHKISFAIDPNYLTSLFYIYEVKEDIIL